MIRSISGDGNRQFVGGAASTAQGAWGAFYGTSNLVFKPIYWKGSGLNQSLLYGEFLFVAGGGYSWLSNSRRPVVDFGLAIRFIAYEFFSLRLDVRPTFFILASGDDAGDSKNDLWIGLGTSFSF